MIDARFFVEEELIEQRKYTQEQIDRIEKAIEDITPTIENFGTSHSAGYYCGLWMDDMMEYEDMDSDLRFDAAAIALLRLRKKENPDGYNEWLEKYNKQKEEEEKWMEENSERVVELDDGRKVIISEDLLEKSKQVKEEALSNAVKYYAHLVLWNIPDFPELSMYGIYICKVEDFDREQRFIADDTIDTSLLPDWFCEETKGLFSIENNVCPITMSIEDVQNKIMTEKQLGIEFVWNNDAFNSLVDKNDVNIFEDVL